MASTNKTTNYELSQYVGSDKPTYLGDYNSDMSKIDTQMKANHDLATSASATATTANETAGTALSNATTAQSTAETANTTATSALAKATTNEASINKFNLTEFTRFDNTNITFGDGVGYSANYLTLATDTTNSIFKLYGAIALTITTGGQRSIFIQTALRPTEDYVIDPAGLYIGTATGRARLFISTTGQIEIRFAGTTGSGQLVLFPCIYFNINFGDVPTP